MTAPRILIVEDCAETRQCYADLFRGHGFRVDLAANGAEALLAVQRRIPDVVLTDVEMPLLDGLGLTLRLRDLTETRRIPIVAITGNTLNRIVGRARESGCDAVLLKPCAPKILLATIETALTRNASTHAGAMR